MAISGGGFLGSIVPPKSARFLAAIGLQKSARFSAGLRATALAYAEDCYATTIRQPPEMPGLGAAVRPFGRWRHLGVAQGQLVRICRQHVLAAVAVLGRPGLKLFQMRSTWSEISDEVDLV